ncbi:DUF262 domain-containing protein [Fusobacterium sp. PH5-44]|uniref:DUF262 domain-containing protein n=1 Tax=unclassified Fusobacterium TaxID=2648384 RepID=UPI003D1D9A66
MERDFYEDDKIDIEKETEYLEDSDNIESVEPFDPKNIRISTAVISLESLVKRLEHEEIDLSPDFQRNRDLWDNTRMSRLIESIILRLPLPIFYFDVSDDSKWIVIDGLQRLSTIHKFIVSKTLKLKNLEFLTNLNGKAYKDLDRSIQRIIDETQINTYQIEPQTPKEVKYSILLKTKEFGDSITKGTNDRKVVTQRFTLLKNLLNEVLNHDN